MGNCVTIVPLNPAQREAAKVLGNLAVLLDKMYWKELPQLVGRGFDYYVLVSDADRETENFKNIVLELQKRDEAEKAYTAAYEVRKAENAAKAAAKRKSVLKEQWENNPAEGKNIKPVEARDEAFEAWFAKKVQERAAKDAAEEAERIAALQRWEISKAECDGHNSH